MLVWINGPFGAGKTTTAEHLATQRPDARLFDPEVVGYMLRRFIVEPVDDFQSWTAWRVLAAETAVQLHAHYGGDIVAPMSLLDRSWTQEIHDRVAAHDVPQLHVLLHVREDELRRRITTDEVESGAVQWRLDAIERYHAAEPWLRELGPVIDTSDMSVADVHRAVATLIRQAT